MDFTLFGFTIIPKHKEYGFDICCVLLWDDVFQRSLFSFYWDEGEITLDILFFRILGVK